MNYTELAETYKPDVIKVLLIGEAPPPKGKSYFYMVPDIYPIKANLIEDDTSMPATIFNHFFGRRPNSPNEYQQFLFCLKSRGIFLIDIYNYAIKIRDGRNGLIQENVDILISAENLNDLKNRISELSNIDTKIIFLLPRNNYLKTLRREFVGVSFISWKCFRLDISQANDCCD